MGMTGAMRAGLSVAVILWAGAALAEGCGCNPLPSEGVYGTSEPLTLSYVDGDAAACPTQMRIQAKRFDGPDVDVILHCSAGTGYWSGAEPSPFGGPFLYELTAAPPPLDMSSGEYTAQLEASFAMTEGFTLEITLPPAMSTMGKPNRKLPMELQGQGRAAACMCAKVRKEFEHISGRLASYQDKGLIAQARAEGLRGSGPGENFWMDDNRRLHAFGGDKPRYSYDDLTLASTATGGAPPAPEEIVPQGELNAGDRSAGARTQPGAYAQVDPVSCKIKMMEPADVAKSCQPAIIIKGAFTHEATHRESCRRWNKPPTYTAPDGRVINWDNVDPFVGVLVDGISAPRSSFYAWLQVPENQAAEEAAAYGREVGVLQDWLAANCP